METNPSGPVTRGVESAALPAQTTGALPMAMALAANPAGLADREAFPITVDPTTGRVRTDTGGTPPPSALSQAPIEAAAAGDNVLIAAPGPGLRLRIYHFNFLARGAVNARLRSAATNLSGLYNMVAGLGFAYDSPGGVAPLVCGVNEAFIVNLSAAVGIDGFVQYSVAP